MGVTQHFYKSEDWKEVGFSSLDDFNRNFWEAWFIPMDPNNLLTVAWKWRHEDVSKHTDGDLAAALGRIKAKTFVTPFAGDMFFPVSDHEDEQVLIPDSELRVIESTWGHFTMFAMSGPRGDRHRDRRPPLDESRRIDSVVSFTAGVGTPVWFSRSVKPVSLAADAR
jgi:hypothetical protein